MRLVKLPAMNLEPGMFVAELDRPWLETPFAIQGFVVRDSEEVLYVSNYVDHVYVDAEYTGIKQSLKLAVAAMKTTPKTTLRSYRLRFTVRTNTATAGRNRMTIHDPAASCWPR